MPSKTTQDEGNRRTELITLRASKPERERLAALAEKQGVGFAEMIREAVNGVARRARVPRVFR